MRQIASPFTQLCRTSWALRATTRAKTVEPRNARVHRDAERAHQLREQHRLSPNPPAPRGHCERRRGRRRGTTKRKSASRRWKGTPSGVLSIAFHPTLPHLVGTASDDEGDKLWNHETQECIATLKGHDHHHHQGTPTPLVVQTPTTSTLTSSAASPFTQPSRTSWALRGDTTVRLWNHETQECIATLRGYSKVLSIAFHPTLPHLVGTASTPRFGCGTTKRKSASATLRGTGNWVTSIAFSPNPPRTSWALRSGTRLPKCGMFQENLQAPARV